MIKEVFIQVGFILFFIVTSVFLGVLLEKQYSFSNVVYASDRSFLFKENPTINYIVETCNSAGSIDNKLYCVQGFVKGFYSYVVRDDNQDVSFDILVAEGGDCRNWSQFWDYIAFNMDFKKENVRLLINESEAHVFGIYSSEEGYCVVDQTEVNCFIYG